MNSTASDLTTKTQYEWFQDIFYSAIDNGFSTALWRLPNTTTFHALVSTTAEKIPNEKTLEELATGFLFAPFDKSRARIFLKGDFVFSFEENELVSSNYDQHENTGWLQNQSKKNSRPKINYNNSGPSAHSSVDYRSLVEKSISAIEENDFEKVVVSRIKKINLDDSFDPIEAFQKLATAYPNAFISLVSIHNVGTWLGASPEILVNINGDQFKTVALAGSQPLKPGTNSKDVAWTQKEIEEQALVSRYIINCFKKIRLREFEEHGPQTVIAGNILHLNTDLIVDMRATNFPQLGSVMLELLHPTSAVCGMPLENAFPFIIENEGYDREFYSGYLGAVNFQNQTNLFVNLRCLQLLKEEAIIYAGAGITKDSDPEKEWEETELKMNTLLQVLTR